MKILKNDLINFDSDSKKNIEAEVMGELLAYLRKNKYMPVLMLCRNIVKIKIFDNIAEIEVNENGNEIFSNEIYLKILQEFFKTKNLDVRKFEKNLLKIEKTDVQKLNDLVGGRLEIKRTK